MLRGRLSAIGLFLLAVLLLFAAGTEQPLNPRSAPPAHASNHLPRISLARTSLAFEENRGQAESEVLFQARSPGGRVMVTASRATFELRGSANAAPATFGIRLLGGNNRPRVVGRDKLAETANYFIGSDRANWHRNIPTFANVAVEAVYPGIDLIYYGNVGGEIEYDFVVSADADPAAIRLAFEGVDGVALEPNGDLALKVSGREVVQRRPRVFQDIGSGRRELDSAYVISGDAEIAFRVEGRIPGHTMVIDPAIIYSTYLGGLGYNSALGVAVDQQGSAYLTGASTSTAFPTASPIRASSAGSTDVFVAKLNGAGTGLVYATYLGGSANDVGTGIAVDEDGNAYVTGYTNSSGFPTVGPIQAAGRGGTDVFVAKINAAGDDLVYSTYLGGKHDDYCFGIAVDRQGDAYLTGTTDSTEFPTVNAIDASKSGEKDAFVAKLNATGSALVFSTYLGGSASDHGSGIAVDGQGDAYVTGETRSDDFPTAGAISSANSGATDAFVAKIDGGGTAIVYSTYLGGPGLDHGSGIAVDGTGAVRVAGYTDSTSFPTMDPIQQENGGGMDGFLAKINAAGSDLVYSTYLGGSGYDYAFGVAGDGQGNTYVTGYTNSIDFPTAGPIRLADGWFSDAFVAKIDAAGSGLLYSTYLGGSGDDVGSSIALDGRGDAYVVGDSASTDFPAASAFQDAHSSNGASPDAFVAKISGTLALTLSDVSPRTGSTRGGTKVKLWGGNFPNDAKVTFGGQDATDVNVDLAYMTVTPPLRPAGSVDVAVTNTATSETAELARAFTYIDPPSIAGIDPKSGSSIGGTSVTIHGASFAEGAEITFGDLAAEAVVVVDESTIRATSPSRVAGTVDVVVTNADGQSAESPESFVYVKEEERSGCGVGGPVSLSTLAVGFGLLILLRFGRRDR